MTEPVYQHEASDGTSGEFIADVVVVELQPLVHRFEALMQIEDTFMIIGWWALDGDGGQAKRIRCGHLYRNRPLAVAKWNRRHGLNRTEAIFEHLVEVPLR